MMFFNNMFSNMQQPQQSAPVMGAPGSPFAMPMQQQQMPMRQPVMMTGVNGGGMVQAPQAIQNLVDPNTGALNFASRWGER